MVPTNTTAAFVGRALRGPLDTPILIHSLAEFRRRFGGFWQGSSLGPAVEQFFMHGGKRTYIIRVANAARGAMICLPAARGVLVLRATEVGSAEHIRAAIDYDGIDPDDDSLFNLTIQRVSPDNGLVLDQEIFRRLTCVDGEERNVADVLATSALARAKTPLPGGRPVSTNADYVEPAQTGTDGQPLSDYDLIGSANRSTGLFALNQVEQFDLLYLPPPGPGQVPGPAAVLAAELYCRKRGAMLILDPPEHWKSPYDAIRGTRQAGYANVDALSYFPRAKNRGEQGGPSIAIGGAIAGLLCKLDRTRGPWEDLDQAGLTLSRALIPAVDIFSSDAHLLVKEGLNVLAGQSPGHAMICGSVTLAHGTQGSDQFADLRHRRLCLMITNAIDRATRWAVFEPNAVTARERIVNKVHAFMCALSDAGAFENDRFLVQCDAGTRDKPVDPDNGITNLLAFLPAGARESVAITIHQTASGCRVSRTAFAPVRADVA